MLALRAATRLSRPQVRTAFSFAGAKKLTDLIHADKFKGKSALEIADIWRVYHHQKPNVLGFHLDPARGRQIVENATKWPFFIQPVFRKKGKKEMGYFMLLLQFQRPNYFLLTYLRAYMDDPAGAAPLLTFSVFNDFKDISLVRADVIDKNLEKEKTFIVNSVLSQYTGEAEWVKLFNEDPGNFYYEDFVDTLKPKKVIDENDFVK